MSKDEIKTVTHYWDGKADPSDYVTNSDEFKAILDSLAKEPSGGLKSDGGKAPLSLIPREYIEGTAQAFAYGAGKYGKHNFRKGIESTRTLDAAMRHILAFLDREDLDPESGLNHLFHASASLAMTIYNLKHNGHLDDRYKKE